MIKINWNQVLTTTISTFVAAVILAAATIVWKGATTVDSKVENATSTLENTVKYLKAAVDLMEDEIKTSRMREAELQGKIIRLEDLLNEQRYYEEPEVASPKLPLPHSVPKIENYSVEDRMTIQQRLPDLQFKR